MVRIQIVLFAKRAGAHASGSTVLVYCLSMKQEPMFQVMPY